VKAQEFYSHGKLLITGEYLVLDGAKALALPCSYGQSLKVGSSKSNLSKWKGYDDQNQIWLDFDFDLMEVINKKKKGKNEIEQRLFQIFRAAHELNPEVFEQNYNFETQLEFPKDWGLGTSSTLITNIAKWAMANPYDLLASTFGGSGYDIACASSSSAITYQLGEKHPQVEPAVIPEALQAYIHFIYLEQKQNSREAIVNYKKVKPRNLERYISEINRITEAVQTTDSLQKAQDLIENHEELLSSILKLEPIQKRLFSDFDGAIKSLGAWGGDFIMAVSQDDPTSYFKEKGYKTILNYKDMVLKETP
jgi:mevalonate kinase